MSLKNIFSGLFSTKEQSSIVEITPPKIIEQIKAPILEKAINLIHIPQFTLENGSYFHETPRKIIYKCQKRIYDILTSGEDKKQVFIEGIDKDLLEVFSLQELRWKQVSIGNYPISKKWDYISSMEFGEEKDKAIQRLFDSIPDNKISAVGEKPILFIDPYSPSGALKASVENKVNLLLIQNYLTEKQKSQGLELIKSIAESSQALTDAAINNSFYMDGHILSKLHLYGQENLAKIFKVLGEYQNYICQCNQYEHYKDLCRKKMICSIASYFEKNPEKFETNPDVYWISGFEDNLSNSVNAYNNDLETNIGVNLYRLDEDYGRLSI